MIMALNSLLDLVEDHLTEDKIDITVRHGYASTEAFGRAFRSVHGTTVADARARGGPLRTQPKLRLRITIEGNTVMDARILNLPEVTLVGHSANVPLIQEGANPHIQAHWRRFPWRSICLSQRCPAPSRVASSQSRPKSNLSRVFPSSRP